MTDPFALNLRHLRGVSAIVATGGVGAAAAVVGLSQPALTQGLAKLEARLGAPLFARHAGGMTATPAGTAVATRADEAFAQLAAALRSTRRGGFTRPERLVTMAQLRALLALADAGSYVAAAAATGLSQPALHRAVRDIERLAGSPLSEPRGRGVALTEAGRRVARGCRLAIVAIAAATAEIGAAAGQGAGTITIGAMPLARARLLPAAIARVHAAHPELGLVVIEGGHRELIELLRDGRIDLTIGALRDPAPGADVVQRPLLRDAVAIVARAGHRLAGDAAPSIADLAAYPWIVGRPDTPLRAQWEALFAGHARPAAPIDCGSVMVIRGLLLAGEYLTLLSPDQIAFERAAGLLALVGPPLPGGGRTIGVTTRADWRPTPAQADFLTALTLPENQSTDAQTDLSATPSLDSAGA